MLFNKAGLEKFMFKKPGPAISISEKLSILDKNRTAFLKNHCNIPYDTSNLSSILKKTIE